MESYIELGREAFLTQISLALLHHSLFVWAAIVQIPTHSARGPARARWWWDASERRITKRRVREKNPSNLLDNNLENIQFLDYWITSVLWIWVFLHSFLLPHCFAISSSSYGELKWIWWACPCLPPHWHVRHEIASNFPSLIIFFVWRLIMPCFEFSHNFLSSSFLTP